MERRNPPPPQQQENSFLNIVFNVLIPVIILIQGKRVIENPSIVLATALLFPVSYFIYDLFKRRKVNALSILGFVSVLLTGGVGLLELPRSWFILKETAIPAIIGLIVLISLKTPWPLIHKLVYNHQIFDVDKIKDCLRSRGTESAMDHLLTRCTLLLSASFFLSAVLNYILASYFVTTEPSANKVQFNEQVGAMTGWSYLIIAVPSTLILFGILFFLVRGIRKLSGLSFEEALAEHLREKQ